MNPQRQLLLNAYAALWCALATCVLVVVLAGCQGCKGPYVPPGGSDCVAACVNMRALECHGAVNGDPTPGPEKTPCETWRCQTPDEPSRTACIAKATSCEAARACR